MANRGSVYEVGYGKPPQSTRFKKGVSGNPRGRPKTSQQKLGSVMTDVLNREIEYMEAGRPKRASIMEVIITQLVSRAAKGDVAAGRMILKLKQHVDTHGEFNPVIILLTETQAKF
jgi:hypothetical protein